MPAKKYFTQQEQKAARSAINARHYESNLDKERDRCRAGELGRRRADPEKYLHKSWRRTLRVRYGMTPEMYSSMLAAQGGKCALFEVCGSTSPGGRLRHYHVDHNHETGRVRGLLCHRCNLYRVAANTVSSAQAVARYLEREYL